MGVAAFLAALAASGATVAVAARVAQRPRRPRPSPPRRVDIDAVRAACAAGDRGASLALCDCPATSGAALHWTDVLALIEAAREAGLSTVPAALALAVAERESGFRPGVVRVEPCTWVRLRDQGRIDDSPFRDDCCAWGSYGLMQVLFSTALAVAPTLVDASVHPREQLLDPALSVTLGLRGLTENFARYGNWPDALAAYNSGRPVRQAPARTRVYVAEIGERREAWEREIDAAADLRQHTEGE